MRWRIRLSRGWQRRLRKFYVNAGHTTFVARSRQGSYKDWNADDDGRVTLSNGSRIQLTTHDDLET